MTTLYDPQCQQHALPNGTAHVFKFDLMSSIMAAGRLHITHNTTRCYEWMGDGGGCLETERTQAQSSSLRSIKAPCFVNTMLIYDTVFFYHSHFAVSQFSSIF